MDPTDRTSRAVNDSAEPRVGTGSRGGFPILIACMLAWAGVMICFLLLQHHGSARWVLCPSFAGCDAILTSKYATLLGVPLPWLGLVFYLMVLVLLLIIYAAGSKTSLAWVLDVVVWLSVAGLSFSVSLMVIQFGILRGFCPLCTFSAAIMFGLFAAVRMGVRVSAGEGFDGSPTGALALTGFALITLASLMILGWSSQVESVGDGASREVAIDLSTARISGVPDAKVRLVVFSDFQCPICARLAPVLKRIREEFPSDVMIAYRYFPVEDHERAFPAAVAAECAAQQGAFWEYHDRLFAGGGDLSDARFLLIAESLGLDQVQFQTCLSSGEARKRVEASYADAVKHGLPGVPLIFLNGVMVRGPVDDHDRLVKLIRDRLAQGGEQRR